MKDINFFSPYLDKNKVKFDNTFFLAVLLLVFSLSLLGYSIINQFKVNKLADKVVEFKNVAENPKTMEIVESINRDDEELTRLRTEVSEIRELKNLLLEKDIINSAYIETIISKKPNDLFFTDLRMTSESANITGVANNRLSIAKLAKGLESIEEFTDVFILNMTKDETDYKFEIEINLLEDEEVEDGSTEEKDK